MITVAVDIDEVLGAFVEALASFHNSTFGTALTVGSFTSYQFSRVWGGSEEESAAKVSEFFDSPFFARLRPIHGALDVLRAHADHCHFVVITSRQHVIEDKTRAWLETHFPGIFSSVLFGNHWGREGAQRSKLDMCREVDAALLIDDSIAYAAEAATAGISALLFGEYPWNGGLAAGAAAPAADSSPSGDAALPPGVHRAVSWLHVSELLGRMRFEPAGGFHAFPAPLFVCLGHSARGAVVPALPACVDAVTVSGPPGRNAVQCAAAVAAILEVQPRVALEGSGADAAVVFEAVRILLQGGPGGAPPPPRGGVSVSNVSTKATEGPPPRDGSPGGGPVPPVLSIRALVSRSPSYLRARFGEAQSLAAPGAGRGSGTITTRPRGVSGTADWSLRASVRAPPTPPSGSGSGAGIEQGLPVVSHARVPVQEGGAVESVGSGSASASGDSDGVRTPG